MNALPRDTAPRPFLAHSMVSSPAHKAELQTSVSSMRSCTGRNCSASFGWLVNEVLAIPDTRTLAHSAPDPEVCSSLKEKVGPH